MERCGLQATARTGSSTLHAAESGLGFHNLTSLMSNGHGVLSLTGTNDEGPFLVRFASSALHSTSGQASACCALDPHQGKLRELRCQDIRLRLRRLRAAPKRRVRGRWPPDREDRVGRNDRHFLPRPRSCTAAEDWGEDGRRNVGGDSRCLRRNRARHAAQAEPLSDLHSGARSVRLSWIEVRRIDTSLGRPAGLLS